MTWNLAGEWDELLKPAELDVSGAAGLSHYIHRFSAANGHAIAAFGMTPAYMRAEQRGFSTFEFQLAFQGRSRSGDTVSVKTGVLHVGNSSIRLFHVMTNERSGEPIACERAEAQPHNQITR